VPPSPPPHTARGHRVVPPCPLHPAQSASSRHVPCIPLASARTHLFLALAHWRPSLSNQQGRRGCAVHAVGEETSEQREENRRGSSIVGGRASATREARALSARCEAGAGRRRPDWRQGRDGSPPAWSKAGGGRSRPDAMQGRTGCSRARAAHRADSNANLLGAIWAAVNFGRKGSSGGLGWWRRHAGSPSFSLCSQGGGGFERSNTCGG
jgi:hypothetical protein